MAVWFVQGKVCVVVIHILLQRWMCHRLGGGHIHRLLFEVALEGLMDRAPPESFSSL